MTGQISNPDNHNGRSTQADLPENFDPLKLENQLCFPLYACARQVVRLYTPYLKDLGLTYTQYITMMVLWEKGDLPIRELTSALYLDTGTMTPLLRKMEQKGLLTRSRSKEDERVVVISLTGEGRALREKALHVPQAVAGCMKVSPEDALKLYEILYRLLGQIP